MFLYLQHISIETRPARFPTESVHENHSYLRELTSTYSALTLVPMLEHDTAHRPQFLKHTGSPLKLSTANCIIPPPFVFSPTNLSFPVRVLWFYRELFTLSTVHSACISDILSHTMELQFVYL